MAQKRCISAVLLMFSFIFCQSLATTLPSRLSFLASLLNVTEAEIDDIVKEFSVSGEVSTDEVSIIYYSADGNNYTAKLSDSEGLKSIKLNLDKTIMIISHGWTSSGSSDWVVEMASKYHSIGINNTLAVDWSGPASINYIGSSKATRNVGRLVANWLHSYVGKNATVIGNIHLVGHSLGSHVSGFIAKTFYNVTGIKIGTLTGLDVAAPLFEYPIKLPASDRFSSSDAEEVEAYHTNKHFEGFASEVAKQDFYVNYGGPIQPTCYSQSTIIKQIQCSHGYAHKIYIESIGSKNYIAKQCSSSLKASQHLCSSNVAVIMGEFNNGTSLKGSFYGNTDSDGSPKSI